MKKRRTKKQKTEAKHNFTLSWDSSSTEPTRHTVKGQNENTISAYSLNSNVSKNAKSLAQASTLNVSRGEIIKCLGLASFILGMELVIYLVSK